MKKSVFVLGLVLALFTACGSSPSGKAPDLTGVTSYYVRADGNDSNAGTSEDAPFSTLAKAVETASKTKVKTITVIGTLVGKTEIKDSGTDEILITGKADASDNEKAVITTKAGASENGIRIIGTANVRLENITITGTRFCGIYVEGKNNKLILGKGTVITGNGGFEDRRTSFGGGVLVVDGTLIMQADALVKGNFAYNGGGGVAVQEGVFIMKDEATITENSSWEDGGGIILLKKTNMTIQDNAKVLNNTAEDSGGGVYVSGSTLTIQGNANIASNTADGAGGGVYVGSSTLELKNNAKISGNTSKIKNGADAGGGGIFCLRGTIKLHDNSSVTGNSAPYGGEIFMKVSEIETQDKVEIEGSGVYESRQVSGNKATEIFREKITHNIYVNNY
ncbi:MAG: right-handed parallel beta-helix repeat-containing protein [Treponema sp.]|jgi:predicted outer membrane repeat protein|nr:right-handed parallel beta-helix repeat-containing protein [Treponema sp.]